MDKNPRIRTVVNKTGNIDSQFRTFPMEVLAGEDNMRTEVLESHCRFQFDFDKVYWNSRLGEEHSRVVAMFKSSDVIYDMFAGVGPFAIPAAKRGCIVHANDLNPESHRWLQHNAKLNKVNGPGFKTYRR